MAKCAYVPVSVIIPCYLCSESIERAVESVFAQTVLPMQVILIDDCSPDNGLTLRTLKSLQMRFQHLTQIDVIELPQNLGPSGARNIGWDRSWCEYVAFLDADDTWHPRKLEIQYKWMSNRPDVVMTGHVYRSIQSRTVADDQVPSSFQVREIRPVALFLKNRFSTPTVMLRRAIPYRFHSRKRRSEDYLLWLEIVLDGNKAYLLNVPLAYGYKRTIGSSGLSASITKMRIGQLHTYCTLLRRHKINIFVFALLMCLSLTKHVIRVMQVLVHRVADTSKRAIQYMRR